MASKTARPVKLRIAAINDVYDLKFLPRVQSFLSKLNPNPNAFVLAGDFVSPSTLSAIDGGRGIVAALRAIGLTHASFGNHEADISLKELHQRIRELSKSVAVVNSNLRDTINVPAASWMQSLTHPHALVCSPCGRVRTAFLGLLSDEDGVFRDGTFRGVQPKSVLETFSNAYHDLVPGQADFIIPLTHQSLGRDRDLAKHMLSTTSGNGLIIGGHEHESYNITVDNDDGPKQGGAVRIIKSGTDAEAVSLIDLTFDLNGERPKLADIDYDLVDIKPYEPSVVVQSLCDKHSKVLKDLETEVILNSQNMLGMGVVLSSERTRFQQTTMGAVLCQAIKSELEVDACIINGGTIKGNAVYQSGTMTYAMLKRELPFPTKMVVVPMQKNALESAIEFSRSNIEKGSRSGGSDEDGFIEVERRGFLQVDHDYHTMKSDGKHSDGILKVALPRNLLNGFCGIIPLIQVGDQLKAEGQFPDSDDYQLAIDLVVRHESKERWADLITKSLKFGDIDLNSDGVLDTQEVKRMLTAYLGYEPADFVVKDMINAADLKKNGQIDMVEWTHLVATVERERG